MLPSAHRLSDASSFRHVLRRGRRAGTPTMVVSLLAPAPGAVGPSSAPARVGLVVSRAIGGSVQRNEVKRRLRHLVRARLDRVPSGSSLVLRALPPAAGAPSARLGADLDRALEQVTT